MYKLSISGSIKAKDYIVTFQTREEMDKYIESEYKFTFNELKKYAAAFSKEERDHAKDKLYVARMNHMAMWKKLPQEKEVA